MSSPAGLLTVHVWEGKNLIAKDSNGYSDPYCVVTVLNPSSKAKSQKTKVHHKTLNPVFKEFYEFSLDSWVNATLQVECLDWDRFGTHDYMGHVIIPLKNLEGKSMVDDWFTLMPREGKKDVVSGKLRIQVHLQKSSSKAATKKKFADTTNKSIVSKLTPTALQQQEVLFELIEGEIQYVAELNILREAVYNPILDEKLVPDINTLFPNFLKMIELNSAFLLELQAIQTQNPVIPKIHDILSKYVSKFAVYHEFCAIYFFNSEFINYFGDKNSANWSKLLDESRSEYKGTLLDELVCKPSKRLAHYIELLSSYDMLVENDESHPDCGQIQPFISQWQHIFDKIVIEAKYRKQLEDLQQLCRLMDPSEKSTLLKSFSGDFRVLEFQTKVNILHKGTNRPATLLVFNDCLMISKKTKKTNFQPIYTLALMSVVVNDLVDCDDYRYAIELKTTENSIRIELPSLQQKMTLQESIDLVQKYKIYDQVASVNSAIREENNTYVDSANNLLDEIGVFLPEEMQQSLADLLQEFHEAREQREQYESEYSNLCSQVRDINEDNLILTQLLSRTIPSSGEYNQTVVTTNIPSSRKKSRV